MQRKNIQSNRQRRANESYMRWSRSASLASSLHRMLLAQGRLICVVMLTAPALLLTGCGTKPPKPCALPEPITRPALSEPLPQQSYSLRAADDIRTWGLRLTDTSQTSKP